MKLAAMAIVGAVACGGARGAAPVANTSAGGAGRPSTPCPEAAVIEARLRALWAVPAEQAIEATCAPGRFPADGWAVAALVHVSEDEAWARGAVLAAAGAEAIAVGDEQPIAAWQVGEGGGGYGYEALDLDGDGVDELIVRDSASHGGVNVDWITIERVAAGSFASVWRHDTHYDDGGAAVDDAPLECDTAVQFVAEGARRAVIATGTMSRTVADPPEDCFVGRRVYHLVDGVLRAD